MILFLIGIFGLAAGLPLLDLDIGDSCEGGGTCTIRSECNISIGIEMNSLRICNFKILEPIVCCPQRLPQKTDVRSGRGHFNFDFNLFCKPRNITANQEKATEEHVKVMGGTESALGKRPYMVLIGYGENKDWGCTGTLITERFVLSAAHCTRPDNFGTAKWVRLGELDYASSSGMAVDMAINKNFTYHKYKRSEKYHDITLFKLNSTVAFNDYIYPICLRTMETITSNKATVLGWGRTAPNEELSSKLFEAEIEFYNGTECARLLIAGYNRQLPGGYKDNIFLCAGVPDGSKDTCEGDSGGPLVVYDKGVNIQVGITSFGKLCGTPNSPGVYTRLSYYISWIEETINNDTFY